LRLCEWVTVKKNTPKHMQVLIVEDEKFAREQLERQLRELDDQIEVVAKLDTVKATVAWLREHTADLIFLDIHLADDLSFRIFEQVEVRQPIIFTTAYDQYALRAFKVNSIDYLLKPIEPADLARALEQYRQRQVPLQGATEIKALLESLESTRRRAWQERFMVSRGDKILSVRTEDIAYFEGEDRYVFLHTKEGSRYIIDYRLSDLLEVLDPHRWFRLNRSFIASFDSIAKIITLSKSRLKVELEPASKRDIFISSANTRSFKEWLNR
jgi:DNA-binding LytR/AlgR family response regulator